MSDVNNKFEFIIGHLLNADIEHINDNKEHLEKASWLIVMIVNDKFFDSKNDIIEVAEKIDDQIIASLCEKMRISFSDCENEGKLIEFAKEIVSIDHFKIKVNVRYEDITKLVFDSKSKITVDKLNERIEFFSFAVSMLASNIQEEHDRLKINKVLDKLFRHLRLAIFQKHYFISTAEAAKEISSQAEQIAIAAAETATKASNISGKANEALEQAKKAARKAEDVASNTQKIAYEANNQIKEAKKSSENMMVNYVTILGIFATIIITVFGGINIIGSTVKLLEGNSKLAYLVFVVSFLMICLLVLIKSLTTWINSLNSFKEDKVMEQSPKKMFRSSILWFVVVAVCAGGYSSFFIQNAEKLDQAEKSIEPKNVLFMNIGK